MKVAVAKVVYGEDRQSGVWPSGRRAGIMSLRAGAKGTGRKLISVRYWPWSRASVEKAERSIAEYAKTAGIKVIW